MFRNAPLPLAAIHSSSVDPAAVGFGSVAVNHVVVPVTSPEADWMRAVASRVTGATRGR